MKPTTAGKPRWTWPRILLLSAALQAAAILLFILAGPLRFSRMEWTPRDPVTLDREAAERLRQHREDTRRNREHQRQDPDIAERIARKHEERKIPLARERVADLERLRDDLLRAERIQRERIASRTLEDIGELLSLQAANLATQLVIHAVHQQQQMPLEPAATVTQAATRLQDLLRETGPSLLASNAFASITAAHADLTARQEAFIHALDQAQAAYPSDADRIRRENHAEYLVNLARDQLANLLRAAQPVDPATMNRLPPPHPIPARTPPDPASLSELHDRARTLANDIAERYEIVRTVEAALARHITTDLAQASLPRPTTGSTAAPAPPPSDTGLDHAAIDHLAAGIQQAWQQAHAMAAAARDATGMPAGTGKHTASPARAAFLASGNAGRFADLTGFVGADGQGERGHPGSHSGGRDIHHRSIRTGFAEQGPGTPGAREPILAEDRVLREALPGRMLDPASPRHGWLYLDTWYLIGPWENHGRVDFHLTHPPESLVDLDATYTGKNNTSLRWTFHQSDNIRIKPPVEMEQATYYGYTEIHATEPMDVLVAVASDDAARVWINGLRIWEDSGHGPWRLDEGFRKITLREGFNTVLVRIENGPAICTFSLLLCPPGVIDP